MLAVSALALLMTTGCGERRPRAYSPTASVERPATEYETRRVLLEGPRTLFENDVDDGRSEWFTPEGHYNRTGGVTLSGRYDVWGNRFCVSHWSEGAIEHCRSLFIGPNGPRIVYLESDLSR